MAKLLVHESAGAREFEIIDNEVHMGRELDNTLRLPDPSISRHHCVIRKLGGGFEIQDLQSSNGVLVNGNRVQSSPLRDGDRITLGQVQLTFQDPRPEAGATVALNIQDAPPAVPTGTVRMSADDLAAIHVGGAPAEPKGPDQIATGPVPVPPPPPALPMPPAAPPVAPTAPAAPALRPTGQAVAQSAPRPAAADGPMPAFIAGFLPPVPDDAQPTGERGDFFTRLAAVILDVLPFIALYIAVFILTFIIPFLGCIVLPFVGLFGLAYTFLFIPYCESHYGGTFGKKIMKLRIVPEDNPQGRIDFGTAILRRVGHILNFTILYLLVFGDERKHVGDMISKSVCIKVDR
ncbi:MAG: FHA domain-containing protein [Acidobacteria bacterium]|nr:FHA domain-containing protein [Acidobacteriota bacterium]MBI3486964.1 FHA domain-containing protein [Acidobacteriota bacterium]